MLLGGIVNKYRRESRALQAERKMNATCGSKVAYPTQDAAFQKGQRSYRCPYCGAWHRSGKMAALLAMITGKPASDDKLRL